MNLYNRFNRLIISIHTYIEINRSIYDPRRSARKLRSSVVFASTTPQWRPQRLNIRTLGDTWVCSYRCFAALHSSSHRRAARAVQYARPVSKYVKNGPYLALLKTFCTDISGKLSIQTKKYVKNGPYLAFRGM